MIPPAQSAESRLAALREGMEGLAREIDADVERHDKIGTERSHLFRKAYADAAARIRAVLEGKP